MEMKDRKLATEIAEERMSIIAPLLSQHMDSSQVAQLRREICERTVNYHNNDDKAVVCGLSNK